MTNLNFILLYVDNPLSSADFYEKLLGISPIERHPTFAAFSFESGLTLGLWSKHTAEPAANFTGGGAEIAFSLPHRQTVDELYQEWSQQKGRVLQKPTQMDFGYTFVILDPDDHRLRVFADNLAE